jgi:Arm DNA-binding domain
MSLTDTAARNAKPGEKPYKLSDVHGLYLQVEPSGSKLWRLKYRFNDKEKRLSFAAYPVVTLAQARERQLEARRLLGTGVDPGEYRKQSRRSAVVASANTFEAIAREWFLRFSSVWAKSHSSKVLLRLENELLPWLGSRPIASIEAVELLESIRRTEARGARETAHRCLGYCGQVFRYAIATGLAARCVWRRSHSCVRGSCERRSGRMSISSEPNGKFPASE